MNRLPITLTSPEQQQKIPEQIYLLMDKQVKSYHNHRHMGDNSSVPMELAQELMASIEYTVNQAGGLHSTRSVEEALRIGQAYLEEKYSKAKSVLELVTTTAPSWQTECRWEALRYLGNYLAQYDYLHLAHKGPDELFYPTLISPPEDLQGIDSCFFYLKILWIENQIMAGVPEFVLEVFWDHLPEATLNQCEQLLLNGMAKALLDAGLDPLLLSPEEHASISTFFLCISEETMRDAAERLCQWLGLVGENAKDYVYAVIPQLRCRMGNRAHNWSGLFL